jgi:hypothetical protein
MANTPGRRTATPPDVGAFDASAWPNAMESRYFAS